MLDWAGDHPNVVFWLLVVVSLVASLQLPGAPSFANATVLRISIGVWCGIGAVLCVVVIGMAALAMLVAACVPRQPGFWLPRLLVVCRAIRLVFALAAGAFAVWALVSAIRCGIAFHYWLLDAFTTHPSSHYAHPQEPYVPWEFNVAGLAITIVVALLMMLALVPVCIDIAKLVRAMVGMSQFKKWATDHDSEATPPAAELWDGKAKPEVLLVSDLHGVSPGAHTLEGGKLDDDMRAFVINAIARLAPPLVIAAGDITDKGSDAAWTRVAEVFAGASRVIAAPGNHDVNFRDERTYGERIAAILDLDLTSDYGTSYTPEQVRRQCDAITRLDDVTPRTGAHVYPVLYEITALAMQVLVLNSNTRLSTSPVTNALGLVGPAQLAAAGDLLDETLGTDRGLALVVVIHHHIFLPPNAGPAAPFLVCQDAPQVLDFAMRRRASVLVHGHEHMPHTRTVTRDDHELLLVSLGSALYDASGPCAEIVQTPSVACLWREKGRFRATFIRSDTLASAA